MTGPVCTAEDRSIAVPQGSVIQTGYVDVFKVRHACRDRIAVGDLDRAYQRRLQMGAKQPWPCPRGHWDGDTFVLIDGRHEHLSAIMLGHSYIFVAWVIERE